MSYIAGKLWWCQLLCADLWMAFLLTTDLHEIETSSGFILDTGSGSVIYYTNWFQFSSQLHTTNSKTIPISWQERKSLWLCSPGWSSTTELLGSLWPVMDTGVLSVYSLLYCRLLTRMTHGWFTPLMGIFHLHPYEANQLNQVLWLRPLPVASTFTSSHWKTNLLWLCVLLRGFQEETCLLPTHSVSLIRRRKGE